MRKSQTVKHFSRPSLAIGADDLGVVKEDESPEDSLRRQLLDQERENDRLKGQIVQLQAELVSRPPKEIVDKLEQDNKQLENMLIGSSRENERAMVEKNIALTHIKTLECLLAKVAGPNWEQALEVPPMNMPDSASRPIGHQRLNTMTSPILPSRYAEMSIPHRQSPQQPATSPLSANDQQSALVQIEQFRMLVLGMEKRFESRAEQLTKTMEMAKKETGRYEELSPSAE